MSPLPRPHGLTLTELLMVLALLSIGLTLAIPNFTNLRDRQHLKQASAQLIQDLQLARAEAALRKQAVRWSWQSLPDGTCYWLHTGPRSSCPCPSQMSQQCRRIGVVLKSVHWPQQQGLLLRSNVTSITFDPGLGTSSPTGTIELIGRGGLMVGHVVNLMGRVRACSTPLNPLALPPCS